MTAGIFLTALSWVVIGAIQIHMDGGAPTSMAWQVLPYAILTLGEVLVSATGLEFAYSQAPKAMNGIIMAFWSLAVTVGSLWVLIVNASVKNDAVIAWIRTTGFGVIAAQMLFFAAFAFLAGLIFAWYARRYPLTDNYRS
jgi:POT family proton-dependent oligopeptide transporter